MENFSIRELRLLNRNFRLIINKLKTLHSSVNDIIIKNRGDVKRRIHHKVETIATSYWRILQSKGVDIKFEMYRAWLGIYIVRKQLPNGIPEQMEVFDEALAA